jgi:hypothetical protein
MPQTGHHALIAGDLRRYYLRGFNKWSKMMNNDDPDQLRGKVKEESGKHKF